MTIFQQPFWLDAVAPGKWGAVEVRHGDVLHARMPYVEKVSGGHRELGMPPLTQTLGPWFAPQGGKHVTQLSNQHELMLGLIAGLPAFDYFRQSFHHSITNWLPFHWQGFQQTTRYTYVIEDLTDLDHVWADARKNIKTDVRKAQKQLAVRSDLEVDTLLRINHMTFARQGLRQPYPDELVHRIDQACGEHKCCRLLCAEDAHGNIHGAVYIVWDDQAAYAILSGADPELRTSGVSSFLYWEAIRFAATVTKSFDFEGSMMQSVEAINRGFGAVQKPYFQVTKYNSLGLKMRQDVRSWWEMWHGRK